MGGILNPSEKLVLPSQQEEQDKNWEEGLHIILGSAGMSSSLGEFSNVMNNQWRGLNGKWYTTEHPNQYTGPRSLAFEGADRYYMFGVGLFIVDAGVGIIQIREDIQINNIPKIGRDAFDVTMAGVGTFGGPIGWRLSAGYFIPKWTIENWNTLLPVINQVGEMQGEAEEIEGINNYVSFGKW